MNPLSSQAAIEGKPAGVLAVNGTIYIWAEKQGTWDWTRIVKSVDHGMTWTVDNRAPVRKRYLLTVTRGDGMADGSEEAALEMAVLALFRTAGFRPS